MDLLKAILSILPAFVSWMVGYRCIWCGTKWPHRGQYRGEPRTKENRRLCKGCGRA